MHSNVSGNIWGFPREFTRKFSASYYYVCNILFTVGYKNITDVWVWQLPTGTTDSYGRVQKKLTFRNRDYPVLREKIVKSAYLNSYYFVLLCSVKRSVVLRL